MKVRQDHLTASRDFLAPAQDVPSFRERLHVTAEIYVPGCGTGSLQSETAYSLGLAGSFLSCTYYLLHICWQKLNLQSRIGCQQSSFEGTSLNSLMLAICSLAMFFTAAMTCRKDRVLECAVISANTHGKVTQESQCICTPCHMPHGIF